MKDRMGMLVSSRTTNQAIVLTLEPRTDPQQLLHDLQSEGINIKVVSATRAQAHIKVTAPEGMRVLEADALLDTPFGGLSLGRYVGEEIMLFVESGSALSVDQLARHPLQIQVSVQRGSVRLTIRAPRELVIMRKELAHRWQRNKDHQKKAH
jgi:sRNA-binding carbon storage regulator CsrA